MAETRWEQARAEERASGQGGYGAHFARLIEDGVDIEGEARLADVLAPRGGWILDAGSGMGRVGGALVARGHRVVGVDFDPEILDQSRRTYPDLPLVDSRLDELTPEKLTAADHPAAYDLIVCVGNVMILLAPETERTVLTNLAAVLSPEGRLLVGFAMTGAPAGASREYPADEFVADAAAAGLAVESRFSTYDLRPFTDESTFVVHVLQHAT
ncbi:class I SAM-dependent methyltransferase [Nocardioides sp.]|jgi:SAM-dependent methyltransferase|uniref:class I SAM-dependent methyltransferase n=1 Tax=Nocardioides sp. TaxID=35761 RepID=UPI002F419635